MTLDPVTSPRIDGTSCQGQTSPRKRLIRQVFASALCSLAALLLDMGAYLLCLHFGLNPFVSVAVGFCIGVLFSYTISVKYVFETIQPNNKLAELTMFFGIGVLGLLLTEVLLWLLMGYFAVSAPSAKLCCAMLVFWFNFVLRKLILFSK